MSGQSELQVNVEALSSKPVFLFFPEGQHFCTDNGSLALVLNDLVSPSDSYRFAPIPLFCYKHHGWQNTSGAEVRVANEKTMVTSSGERMVYIKGTQAARDKALELIRSNPKVGEDGNNKGGREEIEMRECGTIHRY